jgi:hypothetical protein
MNIMKTFLSLLMISSLCLSMTFAQTTDSLYQVQQSQIKALQKDVHSVEQYCKGLDGQIDKLYAHVIVLGNVISRKQDVIDSLAKVVATNSENIQVTADELGLKIQSTDQSVSHKTIWGIVAFIFAILASLVVWLLHKKGQKSSDDKIALLKKQADELNEKIVGQFSNEMSELQKIGEALKNAGNSTSAEPDHSLVKTLADRITFMEMTLYRMDSSVKGHKQLSKSIAQMKDNLLANGYEIVDMLGKEYDEGMKVTANFIEDENIESGKQIITGIVKPQINYKGVMIQSAQITVSQN